MEIQLGIGLGIQISTCNLAASRFAISSFLWRIAWACWPTIRATTFRSVYSDAVKEGMNVAHIQEDIQTKIEKLKSTSSVKSNLPELLLSTSTTTNVL